MGLQGLWVLQWDPNTFLVRVCNPPRTETIYENRAGLETMFVSLNSGALLDGLTVLLMEATDHVWVLRRLIVSKHK